MNSEEKVLKINYKCTMSEDSGKAKTEASIDVEHMTPKELLFAMCYLNYEVFKETGAHKDVLLTLFPSVFKAFIEDAESEGDKKDANNADV